MFTKLNMNDNNRKTVLGKKEPFKVEKDTHFISKTPSLQEWWIHFSQKLKNDIPKICKTFQKVKVATFVLIVINVNAGILDNVLKRFKDPGEIAL